MDIVEAFLHCNEFLTKKFVQLLDGGLQGVRYQVYIDFRFFEYRFFALTFLYRSFISLVLIIAYNRLCDNLFLFDGGRSL